MTPRKKVVARALIALGVVLSGVILGLTFAKVGETNRTVSREGPFTPTGIPGGSGTATAAGTGAESPEVFLSELAVAMENGDVPFELARLDPAVLSRFSVAECRAKLGTFTDPTEWFTVISAGPPAPFAYTTGNASVVVQGVVAVRVTHTRNGRTEPETIHLARRPEGTLTWFTDCTGGAGH